MDSASAKGAKLRKLYAPRLCLLYPIQIPFSHTPIYGLSINVLYGQHYRIYDLTVCVINQVKDARGVQFGLVNDCEVLQGVQIGLINRVRSRVTLNGWVPIINVGF